VLISELLPRVEAAVGGQPTLSDLPSQLRSALGALQSISSTALPDAVRAVERLDALVWQAVAAVIAQQQSEGMAAAAVAAAAPNSSASEDSPAAGSSSTTRDYYGHAHHSSPRPPAEVLLQHAAVPPDAMAHHSLLVALPPDGRRTLGAAVAGEHVALKSTAKLLMCLGQGAVQQIDDAWHLAPGPLLALMPDVLRGRSIDLRSQESAESAPRLEQPLLVLLLRTPRASALQAVQLAR
jgi:hypothetical protein